MAFNLLVRKLAQGMLPSPPLGGTGAMPGADAGMPPADPMGAAMPPQDAGGAMGDPSMQGDPQQPQQFTLGSLTTYIETDPDSAMEFLKSKLPNAQVTFTNAQGQPQNTEIWSLLEPENWRHSDDQTKGKVAGLIQENLPEDMKAEPTMGTEDDNAISAVKQHADIRASIIASNEALKTYAIKLASSKPTKKPFNKLAQSMQPLQTNMMYGPSSVTVDPNYGYDINRYHIIERNKGWGQRPNSYFSQMGIDYETFWRTHIMDKFYSEYQNADGRWVGGYLNKRFETDRNVSDFNSMTLKPGERSRPSRAKLTEAQMEDARAKGKRFNFIEARSKRMSKIAGASNSFETDKFDFTRGEERIRQMSNDSLKYVLQDLNEVIQIQDDDNRNGGYNPKLGHYNDELHTVHDEIRRRQQAGTWEANGSAQSASKPSEPLPSSAAPAAAPDAPKLASKCCKQCGTAIMKGADNTLCSACTTSNADESVREAAIQKKK